MREEGFYWLRDGNLWTVGEWDGSQWWPCCYREENWQDGDFDEIGPRIMPPSSGPNSRQNGPKVIETKG